MMAINSRAARSGRMSSQQGLSLVELLVALGVMVILAGVAVPGFMADLPRHRLAKATRNLVSDLQWARHQAVVTNRPWGMVLNPVAGSYQIVDSGNNRTFENGGGDDQVNRTVILADYGSQVQFGFGAATRDWEGAALNAASQQGNVAFDGRGLPVNASEGSTFLTNTQNSIAYAITVSPGGGVRVRMYNGILPFNQNHWVEK